MGTKIKLTPGELQAQAAEMKALQAEYDSLFTGVEGELNKVNSHWSPNLSNNFSGKITSAQKSFTQITEMLRNGAEVADTCAVTFETVDSQLAKLYCDDGNDEKNPNLKDAFVDSITNDAAEMDKIFSFIDDNFNKIPEAQRHLIKKYLLNKAKYGEVSYTDIYELVRDISTGNISWGTAADAIKMGAEAFGKKNSFISSLTTTMKIMPTYLDKAQANSDRVDEYVKEGDVFGALYTSFVGDGKVVLQGVTDGVCKIIDKTFRLSDISDAVEIITFGKINVGAGLAQVGQSISDSVDYFFDMDNWSDMGKYYSDFYGGIGKGIGNAASAAADVAVSAYKGVESFFKNLF